MKSLLLVATTAAALALAGTSLAGPAPPSKAAAIVALKQTLHLKVWPQRPACISPGGSGTVWACDFRGGHASIAFTQRKGAWTTRVNVTCRLSGPGAAACIRAVNPNY